VNYKGARLGLFHGDLASALETSKELKGPLGLFRGWWATTLPTLPSTGSLQYQYHLPRIFLKNRISLTFGWYGNWSERVLAKGQKQI
jgi:hypothetical protein